MRSLFFDTSAILKYFIPEKGSEIVRWLCSGETKFQYGLWFTTSPRVKKEFSIVIDRKRQSGQISQHRVDQIKTTASDLFMRSIHIRGNTPRPGLPGKNITTDDLIKQHKLTIGKNDWDMEHIEMIANHLRFLSGISKVQVVTADKDFEKISKTEGYNVINPETTTIKCLKNAWDKT